MPHGRWPRNHANRPASTTPPPGKAPARSNPQPAPRRTTTMLVEYKYNHSAASRPAVRPRQACRKALTERPTRAEPPHRPARRPTRPGRVASRAAVSWDRRSCSSGARQDEEGGEHRERAGRLRRRCPMAWAWPRPQRQDRQPRCTPACHEAQCGQDPHGGASQGAADGVDGMGDHVVSWSVKAWYAWPPRRGGQLSPGEQCARCSPGERPAARCDMAVRESRWRAFQPNWGLGAQW